MRPIALAVLLSLIAIGSTASSASARIGGSLYKADIGPAVTQVTPVEKGQRKVAVLLIRFAGTPDEPWTADQVRRSVFTDADSVNAFYKQATHGAVSLTGKLRSDGDVFGWLTMPADSTVTCTASGAWVDQANRAAEENGVSLAGYDNLIYSVSSKECNGGGIATARGAFVFSAAKSTFAHELGHMLGLSHARSLSCNEPGIGRVTLGANCTINNYGDPFDVMGSGTMLRVSNWHLTTLGALSAGNVQRVSKTGVYEIRASALASTETTNLQIPHLIGPGGEALGWFDLEIRAEGVPFDPDPAPTKSGVTARLVGEQIARPDSHLFTETVKVNSSLTSTYGTLLLDANPQTQSNQDAPIRVGQRLDLGSVAITTLEAGEGRARVAVVLPGTVDDAQPSAPMQLSASRAAAAVELGWMASSDDVAVLRYDVFRDGILIGSSYSTSFTDPRPSLGDHTYTVYAKDIMGKPSAGSDPIEVAIADTTPPGAPARPSAAQSGLAVTFTWRASTDDYGVARYVVRRDGLEIGSTILLKLTDPSPSPGAHVYSVEAEDLMGNRSPASTASILVSDQAPPSAPAGVSGNQDGKAVALAWQPSSDNLGIASYLVTREGVEVGTTDGTSLIDPLPSPGEHVYRVYATDLGGNRSAASEPLRFTVAPVGGPSLAVPPLAKPPTPTTRPPQLRWQRPRSGSFVFVVDASGTAGAARVALWLDGERLRRTSGTTLRAVWNSAAGPGCASRHRLLARVYDTGGVVVDSASAYFRVPASDPRPARCG